MRDPYPQPVMPVLELGNDYTRRNIADAFWSAPRSRNLFILLGPRGSGVEHVIQHMEAANCYRFDLEAMRYRIADEFTGDRFTREWTSVMAEHDRELSEEMKHGHNLAVRDERLHDRNARLQLIEQATKAGYKVHVLRFDAPPSVCRQLVLGGPWRDTPIEFIIGQFQALEFTDRPNGHEGDIYVFKLKLDMTSFTLKETANPQEPEFGGW